ncbi:MAG: FkbM family methyltransferase [Bacteroidetes bacterium]|nr:FkbM family methyltransferase [Bacteroidota bacterium]
MKIIKDLVKRTLQLDPYSRVTPLKNLQYVGSVKHGYHIPKDFLNSNSVCYCVGAGEDISFDVELVRLFGSKVFIIDPMPYAKDHYLKLLDLTRKGESFTIDKGKFAYTYKSKAADFENITYLETGIWNEKKIVKFFDPAKDNYAGHSIINLQATETYIEAPVDRLISIMKEHKHPSIDLLKLEIEGSEYTVIDTIAEDRPDIKIICVEFDEFHHAKNSKYLWNIKRSADQLLKIGYKIAHTTHQYKRTFIHKDVFNVLKAQE